jgi:heptosyltransferase-2
MKILIVKLGAAGDVVRTTPLLHELAGEIHWLTSDQNAVLLNGIHDSTTCIPWRLRDSIRGMQYQLVINLEDTKEAAGFLQNIRYGDLFGAYLTASGNMAYTRSSKEWFDLSLISLHGKVQADRLKYENRKTYQELVFSGLGYEFKGQPYFLPREHKTDLHGDVAIAPLSGSAWPMKNWSHYEELKKQLESAGFRVNCLPSRKTLLEHIGDVKNHRCLISGDSLPMHIALGCNVRCVTLFICTSPWEIHDYGIQKKIVSPLLNEYFYRRDFDPRAQQSISLSEVLETSLNAIQ